MSLDITDDESTLVVVMAWCRQATSHYLSQCWPSSMSPNGVTRSQWVKILMRVWYCCFLWVHKVDSRFAPSQWETALLCNDVSHWLGASLGSALSSKSDLSSMPIIAMLYAISLWHIAPYYKGIQLFYVADQYIKPHPRQKLQGTWQECWGYDQRAHHHSGTTQAS